jgi:hypothetical protein
MKPLPSLLPFALLAPLAAQTTLVVPASYTNSPAPSSSAYPYGYTAPMRVQILYAASETGLSGPALLRGVEARANPTSTNPAKSGIDLQITMSTSPFNRQTMTTTFATNHGANQAVVYTRKLSSVQATTPSFLGQGSGMLPFDAPFVYAPANGSLLIDYDVAATNTTTWSIQSAASSPTTGRHSTIGTGCNGMNLTSSGGGNGSSLTYTLTGGPANAQGVLLLGTAALPAPVPIPGSPGCFLYQDALIPWNVTLDNAGGYTLPVAYAANPALRGFTLFGQVGVLNTTFARVDTSQSRAVTLTDAHDGARCYFLGSNTSTTCTLQLGSMIVLVFQR